MRYRLVVFDWDGTVIDSHGTIIECMQQTSIDLGLPVPERSRAGHVIGLGVHEAMKIVAPTLPGERYPEFVARYREHFLAREPVMRLFDGMEPLLRRLARRRFLAIATGKSRRGLDRALAASGLAPCFAATRCADETHPKPHPAMLLELLQALAVPPEEALMIGDTSHDMRMARAAGVHGLAVSYGAHPEPELRACEPHGCVASAAEAGAGVRFEVEYFGSPTPAFAVRAAGRVHGYLNRCSHVPMELDWQPGVFFDSAGRDLLCSTHGATYDAATGRCLGGPCGRTPLVKLRLEERGGQVYFMGISDD